MMIVPNQGADACPFKNRFNDKVGPAVGAALFEAPLHLFDRNRENYQKVQVTP